MQQRERLRILVGGYLGLLPAGGVTWDYIQYPLGLLDLGHDVFYLEDTAMWPIYQADGSPADMKTLAATMNAFGLGERWAYRDAVDDQWHGPCAGSVGELIRTADVLINISCSTFLRDEYRRIPVRALIDSDPMFTQIQYVNASGFTPGQTSMRATIEGHTHHFTFGERFAQPDCRMPACGVRWRATRQPVCLERWPVHPLADGRAGAFTTVMNWSAGQPLEFEGETWGQKDVELRRIIDMPRRRPSMDFAVALAPAAGVEAGTLALEANDWRVLDASVQVGDWRSYQDFIYDSGGEFSVAKETYVKARTGWFSCRSACYLAAGRPVITQDTGWSELIPAGLGLFAFTDADGAAAALDAVWADPVGHGRAARDIAHAYFDSRVVLRALLSALET